MSCLGGATRMRIPDYDDDENEKRPLIEKSDFSTDVEKTDHQAQVREILLTAAARKRQHDILNKVTIWDKFGEIGGNLKRFLTPKSAGRRKAILPVQAGTLPRNSSDSTLAPGPGEFKTPGTRPGKASHILWKYTVRSVYFPVGHNCLDSFTPEWFAWLNFMFEDSSVFARQRMPWRENLDLVCADEITVDSRPVELRVPMPMYRRRVEMRWYDEGAAPGTPGKGWKVSIWLWAQDVKWLEQDLIDKIDKLINPKTLVHTKAWATLDHQNLDSPSTRFYFKCTKADEMSYSVDWHSCPENSAARAAERRMKLLNPGLHDGEKKKKPTRRASIQRRDAQRKEPEVDLDELKRIIEDRYYGQFFGGMK